MNNAKYLNKYIKYKTKYLNAKNIMQSGGVELFRWSGYPCNRLTNDFCGDASFSDAVKIFEDTTNNFSIKINNESTNLKQYFSIIEKEGKNLIKYQEGDYNSFVKMVKQNKRNGVYKDDDFLYAINRHEIITSNKYIDEAGKKMIKEYFYFNPYAQDNRDGSHSEHEIRKFFESLNFLNDERKKEFLIYLDNNFYQQFLKKVQDDMKNMTNTRIDTSELFEYPIFYENKNEIFIQAVANLNGDESYTGYGSGEKLLKHFRIFPFVSVDNVMVFIYKYLCQFNSTIANEIVKKVMSSNYIITPNEKFIDTNNAKILIENNTKMIIKITDEQINKLNDAIELLKKCMANIQAKKNKSK